MEKKLIDKSCAAFSAELASPAPVPGGGGAAALLGALSAALCAMAATLSRSRAKEPAVAALQRIAERAEALRLRGLALIDADAEAFLPLSRAYSMPKDTPGRAETLRRLSLEAAGTPLAMLRLCDEIAQLLEELLENASSLLLSDVGCAASICRAAAECAAMNVWVNTRGYRDDPEARAVERETDELYEGLMRRTEAAANLVRERLKS